MYKLVGPGEHNGKHKVTEVFTTKKRKYLWMEDAIQKAALFETNMLHSQVYININLHCPEIFELLSKKWSNTNYLRYATVADKTSSND